MILLRDIIREILPPIYNVYLLQRIHSRTAAAERGRIGRDLHDGLIQALHGIGMRLYVLRAQLPAGNETISDQLLQLQELVKTETLTLREFIKQSRPAAIGPSTWHDHLTHIVARYRRETGINATFVANIRDDVIPVPVAREITLIVREALQNVSKHSSARNVVVRFFPQRGSWVLTIDDDGQGFDFVGRYSHTELEEQGRGPHIIKERVRGLGGELIVNSRPGQGATLEIHIPQTNWEQIARG